jgi:hypothetical protein
MAERYCVSLFLLAAAAAVLLPLMPLFFLLMPASPEPPSLLWDLKRLTPCFAAVLFLYAVCIPSISAFGFNKGLFIAVMLCIVCTVPPGFIFREKLLHFLTRGPDQPLALIIFFSTSLLMYCASFPVSVFLLKRFVKTSGD